MIHLFGNSRKRALAVRDNSPKNLHKHMQFTAMEQYKLLRTNLDFTLPADGKCPIIGVTSSMRGEGKSTTAVNLSYVIAEKGSRVLLIDGDLRLPSIAKKMQIDSTPGMTDCLMGREPNLERFRSKVLDNWYIMPFGEIPPNPSELLGSDRMHNLLETLRERFDYIVVDLPPVNMVSDALSIAACLSGMLVVVREEYTQKRELDACLRQLKLANVRVLGLVMNGARSGKGGYGKYRKYGYYRYQSEYRDAHTETGAGKQ